LQDVPVKFLSVRLTGRSSENLSTEEWQVNLEPIATLLPFVEHIEFVNLRAYWAVEADGDARHLCPISGDKGEQAKKRWAK
jgi:hypothetical protein